MNVFEMLKQDHQKVSGIFTQLEPTTETDQAKRRELFAQLKAELDLHAHVEETILYPALKQPSETQEITAEAYEEHQGVKDLLAELETTPPDDEEWGTLLEELKENVEHHVEEEEGEMFPAAQKVLSQQQIEDITQRVAAAKQQAPPLKTASAS